MVDIQELIKDTLAVGGGFAISGYTGAYVENTLIKTPVSATSSTTDKIMAYVANNAPKAVIYFALHGMRTEFVQDIAKAAAGSIAVDSLARLGNQGVPVPLYFRGYRILSTEQQEQKLKQENLSLQAQLNDALQQLQARRYHDYEAKTYVDKPIFNMPFEIDNAGSPHIERQQYFGSMSPKVTAMAPSSIPDSLNQEQRDALFGMNQGIKTTTTKEMPARIKYSELYDYSQKGYEGLKVDRYMEPMPESRFEGPIPSHIVPPYTLDNPNQESLHDPSRINDSEGKWVDKPIFNTAERIPDYAAREAHFGSMPFTNPYVLERQRYFGQMPGLAPYGWDAHRVDKPIYNMPYEQDSPKTARQRRYGFSGDMQGDIQGMPFEQDPTKTARERKYGFASEQEPKYESLNQQTESPQSEPSQESPQSETTQSSPRSVQPVTAQSLGMF